MARQQQQYHVYYRTLGMGESGEAGWRRSDVMALDADDAMNQVLAAQPNVGWLRVYPGSVCTMAKIVLTKEVQISHKPHAAAVQVLEEGD